MQKSRYVFEAEKMASNYKKIFLIERHLKENIGSNEYKSDLYFHEYIPLLNKNFYKEEFRKELYKLVKVRNKICHMKELDTYEERLLKKCYKEVIKVSLFIK